MIPKLPARVSTNHKGDFGRGLLVGGSRGMAGAIGLAGMACLKSGVGVLRIACAMDSQSVVATYDPAYMTIGLPQDDDGQINALAKDEIKSALESTTAAGIGPGLGQSEELVALVSWLYTSVNTPMVVDADALNCLSQNPKVLMKAGGPRILTPHMGELRRLLNDNVSKGEELMYRTESLARETNAIIVLKGNRTMITDGQARIQNKTGNSGMATGGAGDVLTGVITALLCQGMAPLEAAQLGCLIHGLAGDSGARRVGKISLTATDIVQYLPKAFRAVRRKERRHEKEARAAKKT